MHFRQQRLLAWSWKLVLAAVVPAGVTLYGCHAGKPVPHEPAPAVTATSAPPVPEGMDQAQRAYVWEIEHHGLVLGKYGFQRLADALRRADRPALEALLSPTFHGQVLRRPREVRAASDFVDAVRQDDAGHPPVALDREPFCDHLLEYRRLFGPAPQVHLALMALSPAVRGDLDGPWQGTCQLRIWGEAAPGRPAEVVLHLRYQLPRPAEETFQRGGWLRECAITQSLVTRAPRYLFREAARERGLDPDRFHDNWKDGIKGTTTGGVYLCDFDRDGWLDLLVTDLNAIALYRGGPDGKFTDVTLDVGLPSRLLDPTGPNLVAAFVDLDGDGWEDLILDRKIYRNEAGRRFRDVTHQSNLRLHGDVSGVAVADYDRDGRLDLYVARLTPSKASSWLDGKGDGRGSNLLFRNKGDWQFEEVAAAAGAKGGDRSTYTAVWLDADNDGWPDLYVINEFGKGVLLVNQHDGTFREHLLQAGPGDFGSMGVAAGDVDNDGNIDLYVANMYSKAGNRVIGNVAPGTFPDSILSTLRSFVAGSQLHRNLGVRSPPSGGAQAPDFQQKGQAWQVSAVGWAYGPALVDLDNDGWLDVFATAARTAASPTAETASGWLSCHSPATAAPGCRNPVSSTSRSASSGWTAPGTSSAKATT
jgi:hypothetical protein